MAENQPIETNYSPLADNVVSREYTQGTTVISPDQARMPIPEPVYNAQSTNSRINPYDMIASGGDVTGGGSQSSSGGEGKKKEIPPVNPAMNSMNDSDKKMGAEHLSKIIIDGYEQLHVFGNKALQFDEKKLRKLVSAGDIDLSIQIPYEYDKYVTVGEFVHNYNLQAEDTLTVSKEFKKEVTPILTRVLAKHGAGLTDEQALVYLFGKDILMKGVIVYQMKSTVNDMMELMKQSTAAQKENGFTPPPQPQKQQQEKPKEPTTAPQYQEQNINAADYNFATNEAFESTVVRMEVPKTGKERLMQQKSKEQTWANNAANADASTDRTKPSYAEAMRNRKRTDGKKGRNPKDYIPAMDEEQIAEAIILRETVSKGNADEEFLKEDPLA